MTSIDHPVLASLLRYWQDKRGPAPLPARRDIDPLEMGPDLLPHLLLCDLFDRGTRVRFRLVGTNVVKRLGSDPTGQYLEDVLGGGYRSLLATLHRLVYCERAPLFSECRMDWGAGHRLEVKHLLLPLVNGGSDPAIALHGMVFRSDAVFPATVRALADRVAPEETRRFIVKTLPAPSHQVAAGRNVA